MAKDLQSVLGGRTLTGTTLKVKSGVPNPFPNEFFTLTKNEVGNTGSFKRVENTRAVAHIVQYGSPAEQVDLQGVEVVPVVLAHAFEKASHNPLILQKLMSDDGTVQAFAEDEIGRQAGEFRRRFDNLRIALVASMLALGRIYLDANGRLLSSATGAIVTIDYQVPAVNRNQADGIIAASWATATTNIPGHIQQIKDKALETTGYEPAVALYGSNIMTYLLTNNHCAAAIANNPAWAGAMLGGRIPDGFMGLKWLPANSAFFVDHTGTVRRFFGADSVVMFPAVTRDWYELLQGSYMIPTELGGVSATPEAAIRNTQMVFGMFGYAVVSHNPVTIEQFGGDTILPALKVPGAIWILDVTP